MYPHHREASKYIAERLIVSILKNLTINIWWSYCKKHSRLDIPKYIDPNHSNDKPRWLTCFATNKWSPIYVWALWASRAQQGHYAIYDKARRRAMINYITYVMSSLCGLSQWTRTYLAPCCVSRPYIIQLTAPVHTIYPCICSVANAMCILITKTRYPKKVANAHAIRSSKTGSASWWRQW